MTEAHLQDQLMRLLASRAELDDRILATRNLINGFKAGVKSVEDREPTQPED